MVKGKIVDKIKVEDLKPSTLSPVIPQPITPVSAEPIIEGATPPEPPVKAKRERKPKSETPAKPVEQPKPVFPAKGKINAYGFLHFSQGVMEAMELEKGVDYPVKILGYKDGILTVGLELANKV